MKFQASTAVAVAAVAANQAVAMPSGYQPSCTPIAGALEYVVQSEPFSIKQAAWPEFEASVFATISPNPVSQSPYRTCKAGVSGGNDGDAQSIYGHGGLVPMEYLTIQHRGYIMSKTGGDYTVTMPTGVDNALLFWQGREAVEGYTTANAKYNSNKSPASAATFTIPVKAGEAVPIRFMFSNAWGPGSFKIEIKDPQGKSCFCNAAGAPSADCFFTEVCGASPYKFKEFGRE